MLQNKSYPESGKSSLGIGQYLKPPFQKAKYSLQATETVNGLMAKTISIICIQLKVISVNYVTLQHSTHLVFNMPLCKKVNSGEEKWNIHAILFCQTYH